MSSRTNRDGSASRTQVPRMSRSDLRNYDTTRRQKYPDTHQNQFPSAEAKRDYDGYKTAQQDANESMNQYNAKSQQATASYGTDTAYNLPADEHKKLVSPAAEAAMNTTVHANKRTEFLENHPHAYFNSASRRRHEDRAQASINQAQLYNAAYYGHVGLSGNPDDEGAGST